MAMVRSTRLPSAGRVALYLRTHILPHARSSIRKLPLWNRSIFIVPSRHPKAADFGMLYGRQKKQS
jgi:hypothetical protein